MFIIYLLLTSTASWMYTYEPFEVHSHDKNLGGGVYYKFTSLSKITTSYICTVIGGIIPTIYVNFVKLSLLKYHFIQPRGIVLAISSSSPKVLTKGHTVSITSTKHAIAILSTSPLFSYGVSERFKRNEYMNQIIVEWLNVFVYWSITYVILHPKGPSLVHIVTHLVHVLRKACCKATK